MTDTARSALLTEMEQRVRQYARDAVHPDYRAAYTAVANDLRGLAATTTQPDATPVAASATRANEPTSSVADRHTARQRLIDALTDPDTCFCGADLCQSAEQYVDAYTHQLAEKIRAAYSGTGPDEDNWITTPYDAADLIDPEAQR